MDKNQQHPFFHRALFWDVDIKSLDINIHARYIIARVICRGNLTDWEILKNLYGKHKIRDEVVAIRSLDPKSLNFLSNYFDIDQADFRCCTSKQSTTRHLNY